MALGTAIEHARTQVGPQLVSQFAPLATSARQVSAQLSTLKSPAQYRPAVSSLISGFNAVAAELGEMVQAERARSAPAITAVALKLLSDAAGIQQSDNLIAKSLGLPTS